MIKEHGIKHDRSQALVDYAYRYAKAAHGEQKRRYTNDSYIVHPVRVARIVASVTDDCEMICAALLHDVVEDTDVTFEELGRQEHGFGYGIVQLVRELTDVSRPVDGNRKTRKAMDREHTAKASARAKTIKLADIIDNSCSIAVYDPDFAMVYMHEIMLTMEHLKEGNAILYSAARVILEEYYDSLESSKNLLDRLREEGCEI